MQPNIQLLLSILLACVPAYIWGYIFYKKDPVYRPKVFQTFIMGMISVLPILLYKWSWDFIPQINIFNYTSAYRADVFASSEMLFLPLGSIFAFTFVGVIEEYMKHMVVSKTDRGFFRNIDDAIEFSIIAALGFAFIENILYFYYIWQYQDTQTVLISFVFRSLFSTFAHILFSGVYGYYYGLAYFADPVWAEEQQKKRHPFVNTLYTIFHFRKNRVFATEKISEGLFFAVALHAMFNILLEMGVTFFMVPFLFFGYSFLDALFKKKENLKAYGYLVGDNSDCHVHQILWRQFRQNYKV